MQEKIIIPKITFGIIVLNGEPFTRYCLRSLYPFAYEIIVVEGANKSAANISTSDGHSIDDTLKVLYDFKEKEDPENKVQIVTRNGFWSEKDEQSQAYAERATGEYLWQVDVDEFYRPQDIKRVLEILSKDSEISAISFKQITFWGGFNYTVDGWYLLRGSEIYHRLFKWGEGYSYATHRPPTVLNSQGQNLRDIKWINGYELAKRGILMYHYSLLLPKQVIEKCEYYGTAAWAKRDKAQQWAQEVFIKLQNPYRVHNVYEYPSWLKKFKGEHPPFIQSMRIDLELGRLDYPLRPTDDIEALLRSPSYLIRKNLIWAWNPFDLCFGKLRKFLRNPLKAVKSGLEKLSHLYTE